MGASQSRRSADTRLLEPLCHLQHAKRLPQVVLLPAEVGKPLTPTMCLGLGPNMLKWTFGYHHSSKFMRAHLILNKIAPLLLQKLLRDVYNERFKNTFKLANPIPAKIIPMQNQMLLHDMFDVGFSTLSSLQT